MFGRRGKLAALTAKYVSLSATMDELFAECKLDDIPIDTEQLKLDKEAKSSLLYKAREQTRLPDKPKINKMWIVKPTIRARLPIH